MDSSAGFWPQILHYVQDDVGGASRANSRRLLSITGLLACLVLLAGCAGEPERGAPMLDSVQASDVELPPPEMPPEDSLRAAPEFALPRLEGDTLRLQELRGQVVLINFWATWCAPCRVETPDLVELYEDLRDEGFTIVGIAMDRDGAEVVQPFVDAYEVTYPVVLGDDEVAATFDDVYGLPTTFVVDRQGRIVRRIIGRVHPDEVRPLLQELLDEA